jgi:nitrogen regulatory protein PII-like uncharacterized protein
MLKKPIQKLDYSFTPNGRMELRITIDKTDISEIINCEKPLEVIIDRIKEKRSLNANSYCWVLIGQIADILRASKEEVYFNMLKNYGQSTVVSVLSEINVTGFFKYYEEFGKGEVKGKDFTHYKVYKGSSEFDTKEMAVLIDGVISEAQELGIDTRTPEEIDKMKSLWGKED